MVLWVFMVLTVLVGASQPERLNGAEFGQQDQGTLRFVRIDLGQGIADMNDDVVSGRLEPIDIIHLKEEDPLPALNDEPVGISIDDEAGQQIAFGINAPAEQRIDAEPLAQAIGFIEPVFEE